jgi:hypothetical protein
MPHSLLDLPSLWGQAAFTAGGSESGTSSDPCHPNVAANVIFVQPDPPSEQGREARVGHLGERPPPRQTHSRIAGWSGNLMPQLHRLRVAIRASCRQTYSHIRLAMFWILIRLTVSVLTRSVQTAD